MAPSETKRKQIKGWLWGGAVALTVIALGIWGVALIDKESDSYAAKNGEWDGKPRFIATTYPSYTLPSNVRLKQRVVFAWRQFQMKHGKKSPAAYSFPPELVQPCSVGGLLNQCMEMTGTKYLVAIEASVVDFGHTNTLNGAQWAAAFEGALEHDHPLCMNREGPRYENLLLIRETKGVVKVIPRSRLAAYQQAGLVSRDYTPPKD